jgi:hypothetical protein
MFILNAGLSHKSKDWLKSLTTKIEKTKRGPNYKRDAGSVQTGTPFDLGFRSALYGWKAKT